MPNQPTHKIGDDFAEEMEGTYNRLSTNIRDNVFAGLSASEAVAVSVISINFEDILTKRILDSVVKGYKKGSKVEVLTNSEGFRRAWLNKTFRKDDLTLSQRVNKISKFPEIKEQLRIGMKKAESWQKIAKRITDRGLNIADLPKDLKELDRAARALYQGDAGAYKEYQKKIRKFERRIKTLSAGEAPTKRLKKAYMNFANVSRGASKKALDKAMDRAIKAKARYNSERLARTEIAKSFIQGEYQRVKSDKDIKAIKYSLSSRHDIFDICDYHTSVDLFNMGPGVYPLTNLPPYPFHPQCQCVPSDIFEGNPGNESKASGEKYLNGLSKKKQKLLLGKSGAESLGKRGVDYRDSLRNFEGYRNINTLIER